MTDKEILEVMRSMLEPISNRLDALEEGQQAIRASQLKVELEQYPRIAAALDGVLAGIDKNKAQDERITFLEKKTDNHDTRIFSLEQNIKKAL